MNLFSDKKAILLLEDGTFFEGESFGQVGTVTGELVFNTGITGYQEVITDPSYFGQLITFTYPEIGNTGVNYEDNESNKPSVKGVIVKQYSKFPSNWRLRMTLDNWLKENNVVGVSGIDTRALVRHLRNFGSMNAIISSENEFKITDLKKRLEFAPKMEGMNLVKEVSTKEKFLWNKLTPVDFDRRIKVIGDEKPYKVVAIDFGIKKSILERLAAHNCEITVLPETTTPKEILNLNPDGIFFSNGPGDPATVKNGIDLAKYFIKHSLTPIFGICLGHQIIGLALGGSTYKLPFGHRGLNHPCGLTGKLEITSQNHGFALKESSLNKDLVNITHLNLNDKTVAGFSMKHRSVFGVQYHPEASPGPHDADHHFEYFISLMEKQRKTVV